ncbi:MAG TPA: DUF2059 domain-containing protein [Thermoanaerobaculia bacterium]|nr:DUF2059 domain-containing protein [Thermoanaerobaculia bacterium]
MKRSILTGLAIVCLLTLSAPAQAQRSAKEQDIRRLLLLMGSAELGRQVVEQMFEQFRTSLPDVPTDFWDGMLKEMEPQKFVELGVPIYDKHFTQEEIRELIAFYETPIGRKLTVKLPVITQESMAAGQKWGEEIAKKVMERLQARESARP